MVIEYPTPGIRTPESVYQERDGCNEYYIARSTQVVDESPRALSIQSSSTNRNPGVSSIIGCSKEETFSVNFMANIYLEHLVLPFRKRTGEVSLFSQSLFRVQRGEQHLRGDLFSGWSQWLTSQINKCQKEEITGKLNRGEKCLPTWLDSKSLQLSTRQFCALWIILPSSYIMLF